LKILAVVDDLPGQVQESIEQHAHAALTEETLRDPDVRFLIVARAGIHR
jgi:hypothetical protein